MAAVMQSGALSNLISTSGRGVEDYSSKYDDGGNDNRDMTTFEFYRGDKGMHRPTLDPFIRPPPSKWDDAEKWLVSVQQGEVGSKCKPMSGHAHMHQAVVNSSKKESVSNQENWQTNAHLLRTYQSTNNLKGVSGIRENILADGHGYCFDVMKEPFSCQTFDFQSQLRHKMDSVNCSSYVGDRETSNFAFRPVMVPPFKPSLDGSFECFSICDSLEESIPNKANDGEFLKTMLQTEKPNSDFLISDRMSSHCLNTNKTVLSPSDTISITPLTTVWSVSMRDMGTEMTPMPSQEPSRTGTPILATTPTVCSPISSRASTPQRLVLTCVPVQGSESRNNGENIELLELPDKKGQSKTRQEILAPGAQLGKSSIAAWATKEEEDEDASKSLQNIDLVEVKKTVLETRLAAWEAVEQAKHMARYKREESKIQAWEIHEMAKAEADMRRIEVKLERVQSHAHEKMVNKLAATRRRAEERRAMAEAKRVEQAEKAAKRATHIRQTGRIPSSFFICGLCH
eukprot:c26532_g2_i1 orf=425-1963(-)